MPAQIIDDDLLAKLKEICEADHLKRLFTDASASVRYANAAWLAGAATLYAETGSSLENFKEPVVTLSTSLTAKGKYQQDEMYAVLRALKLFGAAASRDM